MRLYGYLYCLKDNNAEGDPIIPFPTDPSAPQLAQSAYTVG